MATLAMANRTRLRALVFPREHGAWGMLLVPLATGAAVGAMSGDTGWSLLWFTITALALFWMRTPVESWLGTSPMRAQTAAEKRAALLAAGACALTAGTALTLLFWGGNNIGLLLLGIPVATAFAVQTALKTLGRKTRMLAQAIGAVGLTVTAPAAYYVATGRLDRNAFALWALNWIFAGNQIHFVQTKIRYSRVNGWRQRFHKSRAFFIAQFAMMAVLAALAAYGWTPVLVVAAFGPVLWRGMMWYFAREKKLNVHRLGFSELGYAIGFGILLVLAYR